MIELGAWLAVGYVTACVFFPDAVKLKNQDSIENLFTIFVVSFVAPLYWLVVLFEFLFSAKTGK